MQFTQQWLKIRQGVYQISHEPTGEVLRVTVVKTGHRKQIYKPWSLVGRISFQRKTTISTNVSDYAWANQACKPLGRWPFLPDIDLNRPIWF